MLREPNVCRVPPRAAGTTSNGHFRLRAGPRDDAKRLYVGVMLQTQQLGSDALRKKDHTAAPKKRMHAAAWALEHRRTGDLHIRKLRCRGMGVRCVSVTIRRVVQGFLK